MQVIYIQVFFNTPIKKKQEICIVKKQTSLGTPCSLKRSPPHSGHLRLLSDGKKTNELQWIQPFNFKQVAPLRANMFFSVRLAFGTTSTFKNGVMARRVRNNVLVLQLVSRCTWRSAPHKASHSSDPSSSSDMQRRRFLCAIPRQTPQRPLVQNLNDMIFK